MPWQGEHPAAETVNLEQLLNFDLEGEHAARDSDQYELKFVRSLYSSELLWIHDKDGAEVAVEHPDANAEDCDHHCRNYIGEEIIPVSTTWCR